MSLFNSKKLFFLLFLLIVNFINIIHCSCPPNVDFKYPALKQPNDEILIQKRSLFNLINAIKATDVTHALKLCINNIFPETEILHEYPNESRSGSCYNDAMKMTLNLSDDQFKKLTSSIASNEDWFTILGAPSNYFNQIEKLQLNCLATYTQDDNDFILHMASGADGELISKYGYTNIRGKHKPYELPITYGNRLRFWELKEEYSGNENNRNLLFQTLQDKIRTSLDMKKLLGFYNQTLLLSTDFYRINHIIKVVMGLNLNARNEQGKTPAMIAARKKRYDLVNLYLYYGANVDLQDKNGETLLMIVVNQNNQNFNNQEFIRMLFNYKANPYIKNKNNQDVFINAVQHNNLEVLPVLLESSITLPKLSL